MIEECSGVVQDEAVSFEMVGDSFGSTLDNSTINTGINGLAKVTLSAGVPGIMSCSFRVWAHSTVDSTGVYFDVNLNPIERNIGVSGNSNLDCYVGDTIDLGVEVRDIGSDVPSRNIGIVFSITESIPGGDATISNPLSTTNITGHASATFVAGSSRSIYRISASGSNEEVGSVEFIINVRTRPACQSGNDCPVGYVCSENFCEYTGGEECDADDQCVEIYFCDNGNCHPRGALPRICGTSSECPVGYYCEANDCHACQMGSDKVECQVNGDSCTTDPDCPIGFLCLNGICYPENDASTEIPEIGGLWHTKYYLDFSDSIDLSSLDIINRISVITNYCEYSGIGWVDTIVCDLIDEYVSDHIYAVIDIFSNLPSVISSMRVDGVIGIGHLSNSELFSGIEKWNDFKVYYPNACCDCNGFPGDCCNPIEQPNYPECSEVIIRLADFEVAGIGFDVPPIEGKVHGDDGSGSVVSNIYIDNRVVKIEYADFLELLCNSLIEIFTGYDSLDDAMIDVVDCNSLQVLFDLLLLDSAPNIAPTCEDLKPTGLDLYNNLRYLVGPGWRTVTIRNWATITTENFPLFGNQLGYPDFEISGDGQIAGNADISSAGSVSGNWYGKR